MTSNKMTLPENVEAVQYAATLRDFADRMDKALELIGVGDDPLVAYKFVVGCARALAEDAEAQA